MYTTITGPDWDSTLQRSAFGGCKLNVTLRLKLLPRDPSGGLGSVHLVDNLSQVRRGRVRDDENARRCRSWLRGDWEHFRDRFAGTVEEIWNGRFCLLVPEKCPTDLYRELSVSRSVPAYVTCSLEIVVVEHTSTDRAHARLAVVYLEDDELAFRSFTTEDRNGGVLTNRDLDQGQNISHYRSGILLRQTAAAHEIGHLLLLHHPGGRGNDQHHYFGQNLYEEATLMGLGDEVTERHGRAWLENIPRHTDWREGWRLIGSAALEKYKIHWARSRAPRNV